jgi:hypothetical protein
MSSWITWEYIDNEVFEVKKKQKWYKGLALDDTRARIEPYDAKTSVAPQSLGSQLTSQSSGRSSLGHTNLPQQPQYSGISAHKYDPQAKLEQLKLSKTDPST